MSRNNIYIVIIVVCILVAGGVYYWSTKDQSAELPTGLAPINTDIESVENKAVKKGAAGNLPTAEKSINYTAPRVFPNDTNFDLTVFSSTAYNQLNDYVPLTVGPEEIGRENPFVSY